MKRLLMFWSMPPRARVQEALPSAFLELSDCTTGKQYISTIKCLASKRTKGRLVELAVRPVSVATMTRGSICVQLPC